MSRAKVTQKTSQEQLVVPTKISLANRGLSDLDIAKLLEILSSNTEALDLEGNDITNVGIFALGEFLKKASSLETLNISRNNFTHEAISMLFGSIEENRSLKEVVVRKNFLQWPAHTRVGKYSEGILRNHPCLRLLDIAQCSLNNRSVPFLASLLHQNRVLTMFNIAYNHLSAAPNSHNPAASPDAFLPFFQALSANRTLKQLDLSGFILDDLSGRALAVALNESAVEGLVMKKVTPSVSTLQSFFEVLSANSTLTHLDLSSNLLCVNFYKVLMIPTLQQLSLNRCSIDDAKMVNFGKELAQQPSLHSLSISHNPISSVGLTGLVNGLVKNPVLRVLIMRAIPLDGGRFHQYIRFTSSLKTINISDCPRWSPQSQVEFFEAVKSNKSITSLIIGNTDIDDAAIPILIETIRNHSPLATIVIKGNNLLTSQANQLYDAYNGSPKLLSLSLGTSDARLLHKNISSLSLRKLSLELCSMVFLTSLNVSNNELLSVPSSISALVSLESLDLSKNQLRCLPLSLPSLTNLTNLVLDFNPWIYPKEVWQKPRNLMLLLKELARPSAPQYRTQVAILGPGCSGKSSFSRLFKRKLKPWKRKIVRDDMGIFVEELTTDIAVGKEKENFSLCVWDFGRRVNERPIHSLHFSSRCFYFIVLDIASTDVVSEAGHWLQQVGGTSDEEDIPCPTFVVFTHSDLVADPVVVHDTIRRFKDTYGNDFGNVHKVFSIGTPSNDLGDIVERFMEVVITADFMGEVVPQRYLEFEKAFLAAAPPLPSLSTLCSLSYQCNINDESDIAHAINYLISLGHVIVHKTASGSLFLDPFFLTSRFFSRLLAYELATTSGVIEKREFPWIFKGEGLNAAAIESLLYILVEKRYVYAIPQKPMFRNSLHSSLRPLVARPLREELDHILVPSLLPLSADVHLAWPQKTPVSEHQYSRKLTFSFFPSHLWEVLLVQLISFCDATRVVWSNGYLGQKDDVRVFVERDLSLYSVTLSVRGRERPFCKFRELLELIQMVIEECNFYGAEVTATVPCPYCASTDSAPHYFHVSALILSLVDGNTQVLCERHQFAISIDMLLLIPDIALLESRAILKDYSRLEVLEEIGKGSVGTIFQGWVGEDRVAVKTLETDLNDPKLHIEAFEEFRHEISILTQTQHPKLVKLVGITLSPLSILMEYCALGNLYDFVNNKDSRRDWAFNLKIAFDVAHGMHAMHTSSPPVLHRDLKSPNILLVSADPAAPVVAKIADFGLSQPMHLPYLIPTSSRSRDVVNPTWLAPEVIEGKAFDLSSDVYPFGVMLWELVSRAHPFGEFHFDFMFEIEDCVKSGRRPTLPVYTPAPYRALIEACWCRNPLDRVTFFECCERLVDMAADLAPNWVLSEDILMKVFASATTSIAPPPVKSSLSLSFRSALSSSGSSSDVVSWQPELHQTPGEYLGKIILRKDAGNVSKIYSMLFLGPRLCFCGLRDGSALLIDCINGRQLSRVLNLHKQEITSLLQVAGNVLSHSLAEQTIRVWRVYSGDEIRERLVEMNSVLMELYFSVSITYENDFSTKPERRKVILTNTSLYIYDADSEEDLLPFARFLLNEVTVSLVVDGKSKASQLVIDSNVHVSWSSEPSSRGGRMTPADSSCRLYSPFPSETQQLHDTILSSQALLESSYPPYELLALPDYQIDGATCMSSIGTQVWCGKVDCSVSVYSSSHLAIEFEIDLAPALLELTELTSVDHQFIFKIVALCNGAVVVACSKWLILLSADNWEVSDVVLAHEYRINDMCAHSSLNCLWTVGDDRQLCRWVFDDGKLTCKNRVSAQQKLFTVIETRDHIWTAGFAGTVELYSKESMQFHRALDKAEHADAIPIILQKGETVWSGSFDGSISMWTSPT